MQNKETFTVHQMVEQHPRYRSSAPEQFRWDHVINPKVGALGEMIAQEINDRRHDWVASGRQGSDPLIPGLQEALRLVARKAVFQVSVYRRQGDEHACPVPGQSGGAA